MSFTTTHTFTRSNAEYVGSKVVADLRLMQRWLREPTDAMIEKYRLELVELMLGGYIETVTYGFRRNGQWVAALRYTAQLDGSLQSDDRAGSVSHYNGFDVTGAICGSYLTYSQRWNSLSALERSAIQSRLPFPRMGADEPGTTLGYWAQEKSYSANGSGVMRQSFRSY